MKAGFLRWIPALLWAALIFSLSQLSAPPGSELAPDYVGHAILYGVLAAAFVYGVKGGLRGPLSPGGAWSAWVLVSLYGAADEFHQAFVVGRDASFQDLAVDSVAALMVVLASYHLAGKADRS
ncbi:MAG: VanZ family protein [Acidobacteriota bacterium]